MQLTEAHAQAVLLHGGEPLLDTDLSSLGWWAASTKPGSISDLPDTAACACGMKRRSLQPSSLHRMVVTPVNAVFPGQL